jgi:hypothetical protein
MSKGKAQPKEQPKEPLKRGRPRKVESPEMLIEWFFQYLEWAKNNPFKVQDYVGKDGFMVYREKERPVTFMGFESWIYTVKDTFFHDTYWLKDENFSPVILRIKEACKAENVDGASAGVYQSNIIARINGIKDATDTNVTIKEQPLFPDIGNVLTDNGNK